MKKVYHIFYGMSLQICDLTGRIAVNGNLCYAVPYKVKKQQRIYN